MVRRIIGGRAILLILLYGKDIACAKVDFSLFRFITTFITVSTLVESNIIEHRPNIHRFL